MFRCVHVFLLSGINSYLHLLSGRLPREIEGAIIGDYRSTEKIVVVNGYIYQ